MSGRSSVQPRRGATALAGSIGPARRWHAVLVLLALALALAAPAQARRLALVVGVDSYDHAPRLHRAVASAQAVAAELRSAGFRVTALRDPGGAETANALDLLLGTLRADDEVLVFFSGRGAQTERDMLLLLRDGRVDRSTNPGPGTVGVQGLLDALAKARPRVALLIVDAGRETIAGGPSAASHAAVAWLPQLVPGQIVLFAAASGQAVPESLDTGDDGAPGLLARELIERLRLPGLPVQRLVEGTADAVKRSAAGAGRRQHPQVVSWFTGVFSVRGLGDAFSPAAGSDPRLAGRIVRDAVAAYARGDVGSDRPWLMARYQEALAAAPDHLPALIGLGMLFAADGDWARAIEAFDRVGRVARPGPLATLAQHEAQALRQRLSADRLPASEPHMAYADALAQARLFLTVGDASGALDRAEHAIALDAQRWEGYLLAAEVALMLDRPQAATPLFRAALERAPASVRPRIESAVRIVAP